tara:strand:+ start:95 stop:757 length:663 start_codon:yes stop_codon:yes gene_type:complete
MATVKKEEELLTKETLLKQWNSVEGKEVGWGNPRRSIQNDIEDIRLRQLTHYQNYYLGDRVDKQKEDTQKMNTYRSVFSWKEKYSVEYTYGIVANDYYRKNIKCEDIEDALSQINGDKTPEEAEVGNFYFDEMDYESGFEINDEEDRELEMSIQDLSLKQPISKRYKVSLYLEQVSELFDDKNELIEVDDEYHAKQLTQLIHEHAPHLIVRSSVQQVDAS